MKVQTHLQSCCARHELRVHPNGAQAPDDQPRHLRAEVEDQHHVLRRPPSAGKLAFFGINCHFQNYFAQNGAKRRKNDRGSVQEAHTQTASCLDTRSAHPEAARSEPIRRVFSSNKNYLNSNCVLIHFFLMPRGKRGPQTQSGGPSHPCGFSSRSMWGRRPPEKTTNIPI